MTDHFVLDWDATPTIVGHVEDRNERSLAKKFTRGRLLGTEFAPAGLAVRVESGPDGAYPDYFTLQQIPIASQRFVEALRSVARNFEAYPVDIVMPGRTIKGHQVLKVAVRRGAAARPLALALGATVALAHLRPGEAWRRAGENGCAEPGLRCSKADGSPSR